MEILSDCRLCWCNGFCPMAVRAFFGQETVDPEVEIRPEKTYTIVFGISTVRYLTVQVIGKNHCAKYRRLTSSFPILRQTLLFPWDKGTSGSCHQSRQDIPDVLSYGPLKI